MSRQHSKALILLILVALLGGCAGLVPDQQNYGPIADFDRVVLAPNVRKDSLYDGIKMWIAQNFKSAKSVIEYDNKADGVLIGNGAIGYRCSGNEPYYNQGYCGQNVPFTTKIEVKDGKFRMSFSNLSIGTSGVNRFPKEGIEGIKSTLNKFGDEITASIQKANAKANW